MNFLESNLAILVEMCPPVDTWIPVSGIYLKEIIKDINYSMIFESEKSEKQVPRYTELV